MIIVREREERERDIDFAITFWYESETFELRLQLFCTLINLMIHIYINLSGPEEMNQGFVPQDIIYTMKLLTNNLVQK